MPRAKEKLTQTQLPNFRESPNRDQLAPEQRESRRRNRHNSSEVADWGSADGALLKNAIAAITARGCAVRFGYTRDGSAYAVGIVGDGDPYTEFVRPSENLDAYLTALASDFAH